MGTRKSGSESDHDNLSLRDAMTQLFEHSWVRPFDQFSRSGFEGILAIDIFEQDDALIIKAAVPGINIDDLEVTVAGDVLSIKGIVEQSSDIDKAHYHQREFSYGTFCRSVRLPIEVNSAQVDALYKDGILTLSFPKLERETAKTIRVNVIPERK